MEEEDDRIVELSTLAAVYPELVTDPNDPYTATLEVVVTPENPLKVYFQAATADGVAPGTASTTSLKTSAAQESNASPAGKTTSNAAFLVAGPLANAAPVDAHELAHLPAVKLRISLPEDYPHARPPNVNISVSPCWLPKEILESLQKDCARIWEDMGRDQIVYAYVDHIQQSAEQAFGVVKKAQEFRLPGDLKLALLDYDLKCRKEQFERDTFDCGVCLEPKKGKDCHRLLLCGHVFCVACLQDFYNSCINEGDVDNVKCLSPSCGKEMSSMETTPGKRRKIDHNLNPSELLQIPIEQDLVQRYVRLRRKKKLESDKNTIYCPRQWCQGAARSKKHPKPSDPLGDFEDSDSGAEAEPQVELLNKKKKAPKPEDVPMSERLCVCEDCNFAFCSVCRKGWHGELASCNPRRQAELNEEEKASLDYMKRFSTPCPTCNAPAQKSHGCNHMICFKCKTHFCYLCSAYLMPDNPYEHFNNLKSTCYMRLWELEAGDGAEAGIGFAGGDANLENWDALEIVSDSEPDTEDDDGEDLVQDLAAIDGDGGVDWDADEVDSSDDEEPAPDQRRPGRPHIEIVNFAGNGARANQRIELPEQQNGVDGPPPPVPAPPLNRRRRRPERHRNQHNPVGIARGGVGPGVEMGAAAVARVAVVRAPAAVGVGAGVRPGPGVGVGAGPEAGGRAENNPPPPPAVQAAPGQGNNINVDAALQRFLALALQDREDEWDSGGDDDSDDEQELHLAQRARRRAAARRR